MYLDKGLEPRRPEPRIWLLDRCFEWHFLAPDFTTYFRMLLVHQGLPLWQFRCTPMGLTPWAEVSARNGLCSSASSLVDHGQVLGNPGSHVSRSRVPANVYPGRPSSSPQPARHISAFTAHHGLGRSALHPSRSHDFQNSMQSEKKMKSIKDRWSLQFMNFF